MKFEDLCKYFENLEVTTKRLQMSDILSDLFNQVKDSGEISKIIYLCQGQLLPSFKNIEFNMSEKLVHKAIVEQSGKSSDKIKGLFQNIGDYGIVAQQTCPEKEGVLSIFEVYDYLYDIADISGDGAVAKKVRLLSELLTKGSPLEAKFIIRIVLGRLRLGVGDPTILDSLSLAYSGDKSLRQKLETAYNRCSDLGLVGTLLFSQGLPAIEKFEIIVGSPVRVALASRLKSAKEIIEKIGECAVEAKYDGFRCQIHKDGDRISIYSRNLENITRMFPELELAARQKIKVKKAIFEGEALSYDPRTGENLPFQVTVQRKRKHNIEQKQQENVENKRPKNAGLPWTDELKMELSSKFSDGISIEELSMYFERTKGAVISELMKQGLIESNEGANFR